MPGQFDTTTKYLVETYPGDWLAFLGLAVHGRVDVIDADLSTVSAEVDKVVRVGGASPWLVHLEFQSSYDPTMGKRLVRYNTMLHLQHDLGVASVLVLLRPAANGPAITGQYRMAVPGALPYLTFEYTVRRLWQESVNTVLDGALGTLPLAPLSAIEPADLPTVLRIMDQRFVEEALSAEADRLRVVTYTLLGLRYPRGLANQLMPGIQAMRDSVTYQGILEDGRAEGLSAGLAKGLAEGRADEARTLLVYLGTRRFGPPDSSTRATLEAVQDPERLDGWCKLLLDVASWDELLASS